jgi:hypothetical protein
LDGEALLCPDRLLVVDLDPLTCSWNCLPYQSLLFEKIPQDRAVLEYIGEIPFPGGFAGVIDLSQVHEDEVHRV